MRCIKMRGSVALVVLLFFVTSCSQEKKDRDIKADITTKSKTEISFAGVNFTVDRGVVSLSGICPSQKSKEKVESTVKGIEDVKNVVNAITIGPVVIDTGPFLKQSVDSVLMKHNLATAQVSNNNVILTGQVQQKDLSKILEAMQKLPVANVMNQLSVQ
jgi:osmotically-inducible protein OsmY